MTVPRARVAYFTMEIGLEKAIPTYAGGLGVLAGDTIKAAADLKAPMVAVTLLHRQGYFDQRLDATGRQVEVPVAWDIASRLEAVPATVTVEVEGAPVVVRAWRHVVKGQTGGEVPVFFLDTEDPANAPAHRALSGALYGGDARARLAQETVLGVGGILLLRALGYADLEVYHMNEGHAALITVALAEERGGGAAVPDEAAIAAVRERCVFTTHTPVPAGHDVFPAEMAAAVLGPARWARARAIQREPGGGEPAGLNMTRLALRASRFVNGVALKHGEVSRAMFPGYPVRSVTNGVHTRTWAAPAFQRLFDARLPEWREDAFVLRDAIGLTDEELWRAHQECKRAMVETVNRLTGAGFDPDALTLGFARRATAYKRPHLLFQDPERLKAMCRYVGPVQIVFAGKAHPKDEEGKAVIQRVHEAARQLQGSVPIAFVPNYDMDLAGILAAGVDVWVNTPRPPMEASGTSGMKAAVNGVPSLSVLDGWWIEGHVEGATGWAVGEFVPDPGNPEQDHRFGQALYEKLSKVVLPCYYKTRERYIDVMRKTIAYNGAWFSTQRMLEQYLRHAYRLP